MDAGVLRKRAFWIYHVVWALIWIGLSLYFLSIPKSGDMPASLLVMFTVPAGLLGHGILLLIDYFKHLGDKLVTRRSGRAASEWPWLMFIVALVVLITTFRAGYRFGWMDISYYLGSPEAMLVFAKMLLLMLVKLACLLGLLLRQPWSRWLIIGLFAYWFGEAMYVAYHYWINYPGFRPGIYIRPLWYALLSAFLIAGLLRARSVQAFYHIESDADTAGGH
jgi:hypothetical protein